MPSDRWPVQSRNSCNFWYAAELNFAEASWQERSTSLPPSSEYCTSKWLFFFGVARNYSFYIKGHSHIAMMDCWKKYLAFLALFLRKGWVNILSCIILCRYIIIYCILQIYIYIYPRCSMYGILNSINGKCRQIFHTWSICGYTNHIYKWSYRLNLLDSICCAQYYLV